MVWYLDEEGQPTMSMVRTGLTDGTQTEIIGRDITAGMQIIAGVTVNEGGGSANPFQQSNQRSGFRPGGF